LRLDELAGYEIILVFLTRAETGRQIRLAAWAAPRIVYPRQRDERNLVLVSIDTLRPDHLGCYGYMDRPTSPEIDALAARGAIFEQAIATAPWTTPSHMSLFTSLYPSSHGVDAPVNHPRPRRLHSSVPTLAQALRRAGFVTAAFTSNGPMRAEFGFSKGFDLYRETELVDGEDLARSYRRAKRWLLGHRDLRFFLFFHTYEVHLPNTHRPPSDEFRRGKSAKHAHIAGYDSDLRFADSYIGRLTTLLRTLALEDDTILILTSDHGENLYDRMVQIHPRGHGYHLYDELIKVPLVVVGPGLVPPGSRVAAQVSLVDVMPTVIDLLGAEPPTFSHGRSLVPLLRSSGLPASDLSRGRVFAEATTFGPARFAVRTEKLKYIMIPDLEADPLRMLHS